MGAGMAKFIAMHEVDTVAQYDEYCHFVAGLVGIGLSQMFGAQRRRAAWRRRLHAAGRSRPVSGSPSRACMAA